jgi:hypothetical protein
MKVKSQIWKWNGSSYRVNINNAVVSGSTRPGKILTLYTSSPFEAPSLAFQDYSTAQNSCKLNI